MTILVGYIPTPTGEAAVDAAIAEAVLRGESLLIVNALREGSFVDSAAASEDELERVRATAEQAGVTARIERPPHGDDLAEAILDLADRHEVSLIVIGLRRRSQVGKFILGSHAQRILLQADRPVMAVKAQDRDV